MDHAKKLREMLAPLAKYDYGEFIVDWPTWATWLFQWFVAPFAEFFPVAVSGEKADGEAS